MVEKKIRTQIRVDSLLPAPISFVRLVEMDISTCSLNGQNVSKSAAQRKFYQWVLKWINGVHTESNIEESRDVRNPAKPDVPTLASFLQAIGFKLVSFEKHNDAHARNNDENDTKSAPKAGVLKIAIDCGTSNMRAILELGDIACRCPNPDHVKDASFWSISGTGPTGSTDNIVQKVEETGSNLLPRLSKDVTRVLHDVSYRLFETIVCEPDVNRNISLNASRSSSTSCEPRAKDEFSKKEVGVVRSRTQPEMRFRPNSLNSKERSGSGSQAPRSGNGSPTCPSKPVLQRQKTWDIDIETGSQDGEPRPTPPKLTSSPSIAAELSISLGQISLQGEIGSPKNVAGYIMGAQLNLEKALKMLSLKKPIILYDLSPNQDNDGASVMSAPAIISPAAAISPYKPTRSCTIDNSRLLSKLSNATHDQLLAKPNPGHAMITPKARRSIEPTLSKSVAPRSVKNEQENLKIRRRSFYLPSSTNSTFSVASKPSDAGQRLIGNEKYIAMKTNNNIPSESDLLKRTCVQARKIISPEPRIGGPQKLETLNTTNTRTSSMIKPPTKISKSIPIKIKPIQASKIGTGIAKKSRTSMSKE